ncbi:OFA family MFS transporter [Streptococcus halichoeri]|uniref:L-lactate MFS transporter n=1 Tax=Streptococcus halichoeri TaxID=254785 RepID=UPI000DB7AB63|nr:OFA family MFS transporter [Streptococcus halichoeri]PZO95217.1 MAG: MFS transporter [Streptococcus pyogenes]
MKITNRYVVATAGVILHLMLGSTYAWSVFRNPMMTETGWSQSSIAFAFSLAIFCLGMSAAFVGRFVERFGPRLVGSFSAIFYGGGTMLTGLAIQHHNLTLLYLGYGLIGGLGLGAGYITPVSTIIKWFPDKRGLATGMAIMGFGFASLLTSPIAQLLMTSRGVVETFYLLGFLYFSVMIIAAQFIQKPSASEFAAVSKSIPGGAALEQGYSAHEAIRTPEFYTLWFLLFINIACGLALISVVAPISQDLAHLTPTDAALAVGLMGIFNGFGRLVWASLSDWLGRSMTMILLFVVNILMMLMLMVVHVPIIFIGALAILMTCYGAGFSLIPPYLSDLFGAKELATLHGYILTAWAVAALVGPMLLSITFEITHSYYSTLGLFIGLYTLAFGVALRLHLSLSRQKQIL